VIKQRAGRDEQEAGLIQELEPAGERVERQPQQGKHTCSPARSTPGRLSRSIPGGNIAWFE